MILPTLSSGAGAQAGGRIEGSVRDMETGVPLAIDGDGRVMLDEELAMAILSVGAHQANPEHFDIPRLVRLGLEVRF
jgi:hypothetical protein